jgi:hypothetical protein
LEKFPRFDVTPNIKISGKYIWSGTSQFIDAFYGKKSANAGGKANPADGFKALFGVMDELEKEN